MHPAAVEALFAATEKFVANPHATDHAAGWSAGDAIELARAHVAAALGADTDEVIFTSGATEADNLAILGPAGRCWGRRRVIVSAIEHKAVLAPARELARRDFDLHVVPVEPSGLVDINAMASLIDEQTLVVSIMLVNNEIGTVQPVKRLIEACRANGALLHVDAAQATGWLPIDIGELGADMISISGHKMGGPKGIGALIARRDVMDRLTPLTFGGEQERGLRPGTLPTALCVAMGAACANLPSAAEVAAWRKRTKTFEDALLALDPGARVNGGSSPRHPGSISITFSSADAEALINRLQPRLAIARGSACTSGVLEPSHVLRAIGLSAAECDRTVRISTGRFTTEEELFEALYLLNLAICARSACF